MPKIGTKSLQPFWQTTDKETVKLFLGNVTDVLKRMPEKSVQTVITSPPYWGLRDYGTGEWSGGDSECDHIASRQASKEQGEEFRRRGKERGYNPSSNFSNYGERNTAAGTVYKNCCGKCGATRIDQQIGSEATPDEFVQVMVNVFREVRRVLRDDGTLWLNLGDTYAGGGGYYPDAPSNQRGSKQSTNRAGPNGAGTANATKGTGLKPGNLIGVPWRVALALQADGWILRSDLPWVKRSSMPESVNSRPAKSLEYVFQLTKSMKYFYDNNAIRKPHADPSRGQGEHESSNAHSGRLDDENGEQAAFTVERRLYNPMGRNFRNADLWFESVEGAHGLTGVGEELVGLDIVSQSYEGSHFAVFGTNLVRPLLLCSTSEYGACAKCGAPYRRVVEEKKLTRERPNDYVKRNGEEGTGNSCANSVAGVESRTVGWERTCQCETDEVRPCIILDPFVGSGTCCIVAIEHGRWSWGIDLSKEYLTNHAVKRVQSELLSRPALARLAGLGSPKVVRGGREI